MILHFRCVARQDLVARERLPARPLRRSTASRPLPSHRAACRTRRPPPSLDRAHRCRGTSPQSSPPPQLDSNHHGHAPASPGVDSPTSSPSAMSTTGCLHTPPEPRRLPLEAGLSYDLHRSDDHRALRPRAMPLLASEHVRSITRGDQPSVRRARMRVAWPRQHRCSPAAHGLRGKRNHLRCRVLPIPCFHTFGLLLRAWCRGSACTGSSGSAWRLPPAAHQQHILSR